MWEPKDARYEARVRESFGRQAFMATLGARLVRVEPGRVDIALDHRDALTQQDGFLHAGALASVADSACGYAAFTLMPADVNVLAVEFKINLMSPARGERFVARGRVLRPGRTLTTCLCEVVDVTSGSGERVVATMLSTIMAIRPRDPEPGLPGGS